MEITEQRRKELLKLQVNPAFSEDIKPLYAKIKYVKTFKRGVPRRAKCTLQ